jgi:four helix bundle protein
LVVGVASYRDLTVWQRAMDFTVECYELTGRFPRTETYGLASQLLRAAVSIPSNIAEGAGREHTREYIHHAGYSNGSLFDAETQILLAQRLGYLTSEQVESALTTSSEVGRMLRGLISALERKLGSC